MDVPAAEAAYKKATNNALVLVDDSSMSVFDVEQMVKEKRPSAIFLDVADKFAGYESEARDDLRLLKLYGKFRHIAKKYSCIVVAISQADGSAMEHQYFHYTQMSGSKVSKPGEADVIITINKAKDPEKGEEMYRYLWVCKNKTSGGGRFNEEHRHGKWVVEIAPTIARFVRNGALPGAGTLTTDATMFIKEWRTKEAAALKAADELLKEEKDNGRRRDEGGGSETPDILRDGEHPVSGLGDISEGPINEQQKEARPILSPEPHGIPGFSDAIPEPYRGRV